jgi:signal transduction histidine kinase
MTIRTRLALGLLAIAVVLLVPLVLSLQSLQRVDRDVSSLREEEVERLVLLRKASENLEDVDRAVTIEWGGLPAFSRQATDGRRSRRISTDTVALVGLADILTAEKLDSVALFYRNAVRTYIDGDDPASAIALAHRSLDRTEREVAARATRVVESAARETNRSRDVAGWALGIAVLLAIAIGTWLTLSIGRPVAALKEGMLEVAEGNFEHPLRIAPRRDEFGLLAESFATMTTRLSQFEQMKAVWTSIITHELKTPINVIMGNLQLGEEGIFGELNPKQRAAFATMRRNAHALKQRVQRLLDVSQFEAGAGRLGLVPMELATFLDGVESSFEVIGQERKIQFRATRGDGLPSQVVWDQDRVSEVLDNLLSNAFKFTPAGGTVELRSDAHGAAVRFQVQDTGAGIPAEQVPHLFRRFYQADNQEKASAKGTGLGLAISKEIVEAHGGSITCESVVGRGTVFTVTIPVIAAAQSPAAPRADGPRHAVSSSPSSPSSTPRRDSGPRP